MASTFAASIPGPDAKRARTANASVAVGDGSGAIDSEPRRWRDGISQSPTRAGAPGTAASTRQVTKPVQRWASPSVRAAARGGPGGRAARAWTAASRSASVAAPVVSFAIRVPLSSEAVNQWMLDGEVARISGMMLSSMPRPSRKRSNSV